MLARLTRALPACGRGLWLLALALLLAPLAQAADGPALKIGSKRFTESYILAEIMRATAAPAGPVVHRQGLGNTAIVFEALRAGEIDLYPEYLGTIERELLKHSSAVTPEILRAELAQLGLGLGIRFGFNNGYALAMRASDAERAGIRSIGDLARHPELRLGLSHEFLGRADGWRGLAARYGLPQRPAGLDHGMAYQALQQHKIDLVDIYSTDARIAALGLRLLEDDRQYFPRYDAVVVYRLDVPQKFPAAWQRLQALEGRISDAVMIGMNAAAEIEGHDFPRIAQDFLQPSRKTGAAGAAWRDKLFGADFWRLAGQHVFLVASSVLLATAIGVPLGVAAAQLPRLGKVVLSVVGLLQTVPSLALLAMLIPLLGTIGTLPAVIALLLYALLPIVANTASGLMQLPPGLRQAALALGLARRDRILHIDLPLCAPTIVSGIRTATVINVGTATIAAFIGAGGFGERIATGLALNDSSLLLAGALPAAALALLAQWMFDWLERRVSRWRGEAEVGPGRD
ncbi:MAG: transporter permease subunit [Paucimonas sp.]|nr:transporter permease subunit [Paucimonas sp.]